MNGFEKALRSIPCTQEILNFLHGQYKKGLDKGDHGCTKHVYGLETALQALQEKAERDKIRKENRKMANYKIEYMGNGKQRSTLNFMGEDYTLRMSASINGISKGLDKGISDQVKEKLKKQNIDEDEIERICYLIDSIDGFDADDSIEQLSQIESELSED